MYGHSNPTVRSTEDGEQVGPKMHSAVRCVAQAGPYTSKNDLATTVGPNGSSDFGNRIVNRCLGKGLLATHGGHEKANPQGKGAIVLTDKGARYLNRTEDMDLNPDDYVQAGAWWSDISEEWKGIDN